MEISHSIDYALLVKLVIKTSKQCPQSVTDCVVTHSSQHKKSASIVCAKLLKDDHVVLRR